MNPEDPDCDGREFFGHRAVVVERRGRRVDVAPLDGVTGRPLVTAEGEYDYLAMDDEGMLAWVSPAAGDAPCAVRVCRGGGAGRVGWLRGVGAAHAHLSLIHI